MASRCLTALLSPTSLTKLVPQLKSWQQRPLDAVYLFGWMLIHDKIKDEGRYVNKAVYTILGLNVDGHKQLLGLYCFRKRGRDLKRVYRAVSKDAAETALDKLDTTWGEKYPKVLESWRNKWHLLSNYFKYPEYIRKPIDTTNAVDAVHRQFRKLTKTIGAFPNENSLLKLLYVGIQQASKKWNKPITNWGQTIMQLAIQFPQRLDDIIDL